ncbi:MAG: UDP-diphosphatase [Phycisphaerae bacterium]|nr:UDP-diphosphatase [Phycisphaerae bacterium]
MTLLDAAILGLVEGITEYLPVSSTGHLILTSALLGLDGPGIDAFTIVIQGGAILAVLGLYRTRVLGMAQGLSGNNPEGQRLLIRLLIAFAPAAILGPLLENSIEATLFQPIPVLSALALGGLVMLKIGKGPANQTDTDPADLPLRAAFLIGLAQCIAMWPGTSRSMVTLAAGVALGLRPVRAAEFSFLLGLPTLGGACVYKLLKDGDAVLSLGTPSLLVGITVATVSAAFAVRWLVGFLNHRGLAPFGWYRLGLTLVIGAAWAGGLVTLEAEIPAESSPTTAP